MAIDPSALSSLAGSIGGGGGAAGAASSIGSMAGTTLGGPLGGVVGSLAGTLLGGLFGGGEEAKAQVAFNKAMQEIEAVGAPPETAREILYRNFTQVGIEPEIAEKAVTLAEPKVAQIREAPEFRRAQVGALERLSQRAKTGFGIEGRSDLAQIQLQQAADTEAKLQQIQQAAQQRGQASGGAALAAQLGAVSSGAARAGEEGLRLQAQAQQSALEAASRAGSLAGDIRRQEFDIARAKAGASDEAAMARFNEAMGRQQRNIAAERGRQQRTLSEAQRIADENILRSQKELLRQREAEGTDWTRKLDYGKLKADMYTGQGTRAMEAAQAGRERAGTIGAGLGRIASETDFGKIGGAIKGFFSKPEPEGVKLQNLQTNSAGQSRDDVSGIG